MPLLNKTLEFEKVWTRGSILHCFQGRPRVGEEARVTFKAEKADVCASFMVMGLENNHEREEKGALKS